MLPFKSLKSKIFFLLLFSNHALNWDKSDSKDLINAVK